MGRSKGKGGSIQKKNKLDLSAKEVQSRAKEQSREQQERERLLQPRSLYYSDEKSYSAPV